MAYYQQKVEEIMKGFIMTSSVQSVDKRKIRSMCLQFAEMSKWNRSIRGVGKSASVRSTK